MPVEQPVHDQRGQEVMDPAIVHERVDERLVERE
jgi:hypothetical protein